MPNEFLEEYSTWELNDLYFECEALKRRFEALVEYRNHLDTIDKYADNILTWWQGKARRPHWVNHLHAFSLSMVNIIPDVDEAIDVLDERLAAVEQLLPIDRQMTLDEAAATSPAIPFLKGKK